MTERMIENRVKKLSALEEQITQLQDQVDAIKSELKADLLFCKLNDATNVTLNEAASV